MNTHAESNKSQFLTFTLAEEQYAVLVSKAREVLESSRITRLPRSRAYMKGIINLRGTGVPVIDLRLKFGLSATDETRGAIVVLELEDAGGHSLRLGALCDEVHEVIEIAATDIKAAPAFGTLARRDFISGVARRDGAFIVILDVDRLLDEEEEAYLVEASA